MGNYKILTFEEEKRLEKVKSVYTTVFIIAVFTFAIRLLTFFLVKNVNESNLFDVFKVLFELLCMSAAIFIPYFFYGKSHDISFKSFFEKKEKTGKITLFSALFLTSLSVASVFPLQKLFSFLESDGFIFIHRFPSVPESLSAQITYLVFVPLLLSFVIEYSLRGCVLKNIKDTSKGFSLLTVFILNVCLFPLWDDLFMTVISSLVLSWLYIKTDSAKSTFICAFSYRFAAALMRILSYRFKTDEIYKILTVVGVFVALVSLFVLIFVCKISMGKNKEDAFSKKEGMKALFASSMVYMIIFVSLVEVFCFYVNKPEKEENEEKTAKQQVVKYENGIDSEVFFEELL